MIKIKLKNKDNVPLYPKTSADQVVYNRVMTVETVLDSYLKSISFQHNIYIYGTNLTIFLSIKLGTNSDMTSTADLFTQLKGKGYISCTGASVLSSNSGSIIGINCDEVDDISKASVYIYNASTNAITAVLFGTLVGDTTLNILDTIS